MRRRRRSDRGAPVWLAVALCAALALEACASARVSQFRSFAQAGVAYSEAANAVIAEAGRLVIDESSDTLALARDDRDQSQREEDIGRKNESDRRFLALLGEIRRHNLLLREYFVALVALAESDAPTQIGKSATALYESLAKLHPVIEGATINGQSVKGFIAPAVELALAEFRRAELDRELRARAPAIERELALQHAAMQAITEGMTARLEALLNSRESTQVVLPYVDIEDPPRKPPRHPLPKHWKRDRREILTARASIEAVTTASDAARRLEKSFETLVRGELGTAEVQLILQDVSRVLAMIEMLAGDGRDE